MVFGLKLSLPTNKKAVEPPREETGAGASKVGNAAKNALTVNEFVARTKKYKERGLEPTKPELIAYARYLGIDAITDGDLMWIAEDALNAPLPSEWTEHHDSADRVFYYNVQTHSSSWTHPLEQLHRDTYKSIVEFRNGDMTADEQAGKLDKMRRKCEAAERAAHTELQAWTEHTDEQGKRFYYNSDRQQSVWTDPRPAHCHALYLQMKALRVLSKHCGQPVSPRAPEALAADIANRPLLPDRGGHGGGRHKDRSCADDDGDAEEKRRRKKKKKRKDKHAGYEEEEEATPPDSPGREERRQKPPPAKAEDSPTALKNSPRTLPPMGGRNLGLGGRLATPPGDGLPNIGHSRVRAGIKLEPLKPT